MSQAQINRLRLRAILVIFVIVSIFAGIRLYDDIKIYDNIIVKEQEIVSKQIEHSYKYELNKLTSLLVNRALHLASLTEVKESFENRDRERLYKVSYKYYKNIKKVFNTLNKMHFHLPDNRSFLRVHKKNIFGDNLKLKRPIINEAISSQKVQTGFETGLHDKDSLSYRIAVPIFSNKQTFLGILELGIDFKYINNAIQNYLKSLYKSDIYILTLMNDDFFDKQIEKNKNSFKFNNYIILGASEKVKKILKYIKNHEQNEHFLHIEDKAYSIIWNEELLEDYKLNDIGIVMCIIDDSLKNKLYHEKILSSIIKPIIILIIMLFATNWLFMYFTRFFVEANKNTEGILDAQSSMILLTDGISPIQCNKTFLDFFGYSSLEAFLNEHSCVCEYFEEGDKLIQKDVNGTNWTEYMYANQNVLHKVKMTGIKGEARFFKVDIKVYSKGISGDKFIITFLDITDLENVHKQLSLQSKQAAVGEMIGNIAHQWRQPLSAISSAASGMKLDKEFNTLSDDNFNKLTEGIIRNTQFLSQTIDDFRDFIKGDKIKHKFNLSEVKMLWINLS